MSLTLRWCLSNLPFDIFTFFGHYTAQIGEIVVLLYIFSFALYLTLLRIVHLQEFCILYIYSQACLLCFMCQSAGIFHYCVYSIVGKMLSPKFRSA